LKMLVPARFKYGDPIVRCTMALSALLHLSRQRAHNRLEYVG
jgi:hypothetical protein